MEPDECEPNVTPLPGWLATTSDEDDDEPDDDDFVEETEEAVVSLILSGLLREPFKNWFNGPDFENWVSGEPGCATDAEIRQKVMDLFRVRQMLGG